MVDSRSPTAHTPVSGEPPSHIENVLLATKLYIPSPNANLVSRPRLLDCLNQGLASRLMLVSASAGFGKTMLLSEWIANVQSSGRTNTPMFAWLSLDSGDNDPTRFLHYLTAALQAIAQVGETTMALLQAPQPPAAESILAGLINDLCAISDTLLLVLDDYHTIDAVAVHSAVTFLLDNLPPCLHLVIATRADPPLPLARWRSRGQLMEIRVDDLRFTSEEATLFFKQAMGLDLAAEDIAVLEERTEGWIVGLQMAALSLQGRSDAATFVQSFSGSHRYILDYLLEEVLASQSPETQHFLLYTSILERLTAPLCDAILANDKGFKTPSASILEYLERANLFLVPLDDERIWVLHHLVIVVSLRIHLVL
jgi:LuxR family maltose regulon positive regulatory protein